MRNMNLELDPFFFDIITDRFEFISSHFYQRLFDEIFEKNMGRNNNFHLNNFFCSPFFIKEFEHKFVQILCTGYLMAK